jgi:glycosyltransferase involved in cell wall biosynthesis
MKTSCVVQPKSAEAIAAAVIALADDESWRYALAVAGRARSLEFTWRRAGDAMEAVLKDIAGRKGGQLDRAEA